MREVYKEKLEATRRYFDADSQVFEFGCGTGSTALHHAPFVQKIVATDISSNMIEIALGRKALAGRYHQRIIPLYCARRL